MEKKGLNLRTTHIIEAFLDNDQNYERLLDVGCNDGEVSSILKSALRVKEIFGIDINEEKLVSAQKKGIKAFNLDLNNEKLIFDDEYFDAVFAGDVIEHLVNVDHFLLEIHRTLKKGGILVIATPNLASWYNRFILLLGFQPFYTDCCFKNPNAGKLIKKGTKGVGEHLRVFTPRSLKETSKSFNFKIIKQYTPYIGNEINIVGMSYIEKIMCYLGMGSGQFIILTK